MMAERSDAAPPRQKPHAELPECCIAPLGVIEHHLDSATASLPLPPNLLASIRYALLGGGKRLRPILAWHACTASGSPGEASLPACAAVEFIHAFSLVHDDLPALDNDDLRRGRPTLHIHAGEAMAILAGDCLLSCAFDHLALSLSERPALAAQLIGELSRATTAMIGGQVYDSLGGFAEGQIDRDRLDLIHRNKTGALIRAACRMGALCADPGAGGSAALSQLTTYGEAVGLMFQIVDDLLDVEGTADTTGKRTGKDADAGKVTYPAIIGVEKSRAEVLNLEGSALAAIESLGLPAEPLRELCRYLARRVH